jgi:hypothetical protein
MAYFSEIAQLDAWDGMPPSLLALARSLRASWDELTAYQGKFDPANPSAGQCYPTSRVVEWFYPDYEVVRGEVLTQAGIEQHFWNVRVGSVDAQKIDLSWDQFPPASTIVRFEFLFSNAFADSAGTQGRCLLLLTRALRHLRQDR